MVSIILYSFFKIFQYITTNLTTIFVNFSLFTENDRYQTPEFNRSLECGNGNAPELQG